MNLTKGELIACAIGNKCKEANLTVWCAIWGFTEDEFFRFLKFGEEVFNLNEKREKEVPDDEAFGKAEQLRPKGKWILSDNQRQEDMENGNYMYICSNCLRSDIHAKSAIVPFCWFCGAEMRGEE